MANQMVKDAAEFLEYLQQSQDSAIAVFQLKMQLKLFSKNELVRLAAANLIAKNILEAKLNELQKPATDGAVDSTPGPSGDTPPQQPE